MNDGSKRFRDLLKKVVSRRREVVENPSLTRAAVLVPFVFRNCDPHLIVTRRTMEVATHKGQISFPGGVSEPQDDGPIATALRETQEEIGLNPDQVEVVGLLDDLATTTRFAVTPVVGLVDPEATFSPEPVEVAELIEVPVSALCNPLNYSLKVDESDVTRRNYHSYEVNGVVIWGATAAIIKRFIAAFEEE